MGYYGGASFQSYLGYYLTMPPDADISASGLPFNPI